MVKDLIKLMASLALLLGAWSAYAAEVTTPDSGVVNSNGVVKIEANIVGGKDSPKFLSIVPWRLRQEMTLDTSHQQHVLKQSITGVEPQELQQTLRLLSTRKIDSNH